MGSTDITDIALQKEIIALAAEEGHDADIPSNMGVISSQEDATRAAASSSNVDLEKGVGMEKPSALEKDVGSEKGVAGDLSVAPSIHSEMAVEPDAPPPDPNVVWWDGDADPENPMNWPEAKKWFIIAIISGITFLTPLASSGFAPGVPEIMEEFGVTSSMIGSFMISIYVLGFACGPLVIAPLSEMYGRNLLYHISNVCFIIFTIACGVSTNTTMFIVFRFFQGCFGGAPLALGGGTIADLTNREQRGKAMAFWMLGPTLGPSIGPVAGGLLTHARGWRWNFWLVTMIAGPFAIAALLTMKETYAPIILARRAERLRKETGNPLLKSKLDSNLSSKDLFLFSIVRPTKMLLFSPICFLISLYVAITYAYIYILFTTMTPVFEGQYHFSTSVVGLSFLGLGIGSICGQFGFTYYGDKMLQKSIVQGEFKPEIRLKLMAYGTPFIPAGLFLYGWTTEYKIHWIVPIIGTGLIGLGMLLTFMPANTYLVDVFTVHAASAMAANTVLRSVFAAFIPLAGPKMYAKLGLGWGNSLLGFIAMCLIPIPLLFLKFGERIRKSQTVKL